MPDLDKVCMIGWSYGGFLSALAVLDAPDVFKAHAPAPRRPTGRCTTRTTPSAIWVSTRMCTAATASCRMRRDSSARLC